MGSFTKSHANARQLRPSRVATRLQGGGYLTWRRPTVS